MKITEVTIRPTNDGVVRAYVDPGNQSHSRPHGPFKSLLIFCDTQDQYRLRGSEKDCRGWLPTQSL